MGAGYFHADYDSWDRRCQFYIDFNGADWVVEGGPSVNDTMVNGVAVPSGVQQPIVDGDRIAVGKESKGIEKTSCWCPLVRVPFSSKAGLLVFE